MSYAEKVEILAPYLLSVILFIVGMNLLIYALYWRSKPSKTTRNFGLYWLAQLIGLLITPAFTDNNLSMAIPFSVSMLNLWIIYNSFIRDLRAGSMAFSKFLIGFGIAWLVAITNEALWADFTLTTLPLAVAMSAPAIYMIAVIGWSKKEQFKTFHHKLLLTFLPFSILHMFNFPLFRNDTSNLLWGLVVHILLIIAGSINLTMFHTYLLEAGEKIKLKKLVDLKTDELNRRYLQLQEVSEEKSALFRIVLHDISNPMSAVMGYLDFALNPKVTEVSRHRYLDGARRSAETVTKTIRQIRSMESMTENRSRFYTEQIDIHEAFATIETIFRPQFENKDVVLNVDYPNEEIYLKGNMELFCHSVLGNLISNSLKFSHPGSGVELTYKKENGALKIFVTDQGTGIEKQKIPQMFDIATSHSSRGTQGEAGTGFGMPLLKRYLDMVGGEIEIETVAQSEDHQDHGTKVELSFNI